MTRKQYDISETMHEESARQCFNETWTLLEKTDRSADDNDLLLHTAHCSTYHWLKIGQPKNFARSYWLLSRVYVVLGHCDLAIHYAQRCDSLCDEHTLSPFDKAYAHEAFARAHAAAGQCDEAQQYADAAHQLAPSIDDADSRSWLLDDLATIPGIQQRT